MNPIIIKPPHDYKLINRKVVPFEFNLFDNPIEWAKENHKYHAMRIRRVRNTFKGDVQISTIFLTTDHGINHDKPLVFETMIFGGKQDHETFRCFTWRQALKQHRHAVKLALCKG